MDRMTSTASFRGLGLRALAPEAWGRRLARARSNAGYNLREVEQRLSPRISRTSLARLEQRATAPDRRQDRARAVLVLVLYGVDPAGFDLTDDDVPPGTDLHGIAELGSGEPQSQPAAASASARGVAFGALLDIRDRLRRTPPMVDAPAGTGIASS
jgi:hypothetical protein